MVSSFLSGYKTLKKPPTHYVYSMMGIIALSKNTYKYLNWNVQHHHCQHTDYQITIMKRHNRISGKGPILLTYQKSCQPLPGKIAHRCMSHTDPCITWRYRGIFQCRNIKCKSNLWDPVEVPFQHDLSLAQNPGGGGGFQPKYVSDMRIIEAHITHTARGTEDSDIFITRMF